LTASLPLSQATPVIDPQLEAAAAQSQAELDRGTGDAYDHAIVALLWSKRGDFARADMLFEKALAMEPGNPSTLTSLAIHYRNQHRMRDAVLACDEAIRLYPDYPDAWLERGSILSGGGSSDLARASFARAAELNPALAAAHAGLASLAAREGDADSATRHAQRALAIEPGNATAINALASAELLSGKPEMAVSLLAPLIARLGYPSIERSLAHSFAGNALDRLQRHADAYAHYRAANADFAAIHAGATEGQLDQTSFIEALIEGIKTTDWVPASGNQPAAKATRHIFLVGYPRSGTTLVENILASIEGVHALEERPTFAATDDAFIAGNRESIIDGLKSFAALDSAAILSHRTAYWDKVVASGVPAAAYCFVDMDPMKGTRLPFIARMFPDARILIMRRDPRDVVWSCFRTNFGMASGTLEYTTLERTARHYDALMRLTELALERLPLHTHIVQYHRLVQDFDAETQALCAFAELEWSEEVRRFDRTAAKRGVTTASVGQVTRGLYDGTRQWEPYAEYLEPVMPILQPWIERFGYAR
jgi:tetratricopeptide (TPR) repeat protein